MPDVPNPIGAVGTALGNAAASAATNAIDEAGERIWQFALLLLAGSFDLLDRFAAPDVDPRSGPMTGLLPMTLWIGGIVAMLLAFLQLGKAMAAGGQGLGRLLIGLAQYAAITTAGLGFLAILVAAADGLATGILANGLGADSFGALADRNTFWQDAAQSAGGLAMGLVALLCVIPAAFMLLIEALIRHAAILVLATTVPILAAGLVMDSTARWFWTGLRWMVALLLLTPAVALVMTMGMQAAEGSVTALSGDSPAAATVGMAVGGVTMLVALLCPLVLFKLLAFLDPNTVSGGAVRGFMSGAGGAVAPGTFGGSAVPAGGGSDGGESATQSRFGSTLAAMTGAGGAVSDAASERSGQILDSAGAGHHGVPTNKPRSAGQGSTPRSPSSSGDGEPDILEPPPTDGDAPTGWVPERPVPPTPPTPATPAPSGAGGAAGAGKAGAAAGGTGGAVATAEQAAVVAL